MEFWENIADGRTKSSLQDALNVKGIDSPKETVERKETFVFKTHLFVHILSLLPNKLLPGPENSMHVSLFSNFL